MLKRAKIDDGELIQLKKILDDHPNLYLDEIALAFHITSGKYLHYTTIWNYITKKSTTVYNPSQLPPSNNAKSIKINFFLLSIYNYKEIQHVSSQSMRRTKIGTRPGVVEDGQNEILEG